MSNTRQPGYYWVKKGNTWFISEWSPADNEWFHTGTDGYGVPDSDMQEINETRIPSPDEIPNPTIFNGHIPPLGVAKGDAEVKLYEQSVTADLHDAVNKTEAPIAFVSQAAYDLFKSQGYDMSGFKVNSEFPDNKSGHYGC